MPLRSDERRRQITSLTAVEGRTTVLELAEKFGVTAETIRRDLSTLDEQGSILRVHGGAVPARTYRTDHTPYESRARASLAAKRKIANKAISLLPQPGSTLFLDGGTTTALMAEALAMADSPEFTEPYKLITNSLPIAKTLANSANFDIQLLGGKIRPQSQSVLGSVATQTLAVLRADVAFVGTNALTLEHGLSTPDAEEGAVKRAMVTNADQVIALCDATKFGLDYLVSFAPTEDIDTVVTDLASDEPYVRALKECGITVVFAAD